MVPLLLDLLADRARDHPRAPLLQDVDAHKLTALDAYLESLRWARLFEKVGVQRGDTVATMLPTSIDATVAWWGIAWLGSIDVPISTTFRADVLCSSLEVSAAEVLVVSRESLPYVLDVLAQLSFLETLVVAGTPAPIEVPSHIRVIWAEEELARCEPLPRQAPLPDDVCCGLFTSGTSGEPKCVLVPWGQLHRMYAETMARPWTSKEATYVHGPFTHAISRGLVYMGVCAPGGRVVLRSRFSTERWWDDVRRYGCTEANIPGVVAHWLLEQPKRPDDADNPMRRVCIAPQIADAPEFAKRFGVEVFTAYGSTEVGIPLVANAPDAYHCTGRQVPGVDVRLVDPATGQVVTSSHRMGDLQVRSDPWTVSLGCLPGAGPVTPDRSDGWFSTGDLFTMDDSGAFHFVARAKDVIRRRGENISPLPIERAAIAHPAVVHASAVAVPADRSEDEIKLFVEVDDPEVAPPEIVDHLVTRLPAMMVPRYVEIVRKLPRTATGKVRNSELRARPVVGPETFDRAIGQRR